MDRTARVSEALLERLSVKRGAMNLLSASEQDRILSLLDGRSLAWRTGGSVANTLTTFSQWGGRGAYGGCVSRDALGAFFVCTLAQAGVHTGGICRADASLPTGNCLVLVTPDGERTLCSCLGAAAQFAAEHLSRELLALSEWVYVEGYLMDTPHGRGLMELVQREVDGTKIACGLSDALLVRRHASWLSSWLSRGVDLLFCNREEALSFAGVTCVQEAASSLQPCVREGLVITRGSAGAEVYAEGRHYAIAPYPARVVDTNGAGDAFAAAFLRALIGGSGYEEAATWAAQVGARIVAQEGATFTATEARALRKDFEG